MHDCIVVLIIYKVLWYDACEFECSNTTIKYFRYTCNHKFDIF